MTPRPRDSIGPAAILSGAFVVAIAACAPRQRADLGTPVSPESSPVTVLAIRDPLMDPDPSVEVTVLGTAGKQASLWMVVDTGSSKTLIPPALAADLGLVEHGSARLRGPERTYEVPVTMLQLRLGDLAVERVPALIRQLSPDSPELGLIGDDVIGRWPWEISWDRGTVTLGAKRWDETEATRSLVLHHVRPGHDDVNVHVNGQPLRMLFDTGAMGSFIPEKVAGLMQLESEPTKRRIKEGPAGGRELTRALIADLEIAGWKLPRHRFYATRTGEYAILGRDVLSRFEMMVIPRERVLLRPRIQDLRTTAPDRIRRWPWIPTCRVVGCFRGRALGIGGGGRLEFDSEIAITRPVRIVFGCTDRDHEPAVAFGRRTRDINQPLHHVALTVNTANAGPLHVPASDVIMAPGTSCGQLTVLDVVPTTRVKPDARDVEVSLLP